MDEVAHTLQLPPEPSDAPVLETAHARAYRLAPGASLPEGTDVAFTLRDGTTFAYAPAAAAAAAPALVRVDPFLKGNHFQPLHESPRALAALISVAQQRRVEMGPESERLVVFLRGHGLVFLENGDTMKWAEGFVALLPAGIPARVWAQGPDDMLAVVLQPTGSREPRRTLASEIAKKRVPPEGHGGAKSAEDSRRV